MKCYMSFKKWEKKKLEDYGFFSIHDNENSRHLRWSIFPAGNSFQFAEYKPWNFSMPVWPMMTSVFEARNFPSVNPLHEEYLRRLWKNEFTKISRNKGRQETFRYMAEYMRASNRSSLCRFSTISSRTTSSFHQKNRTVSIK